MPSSFLISLKYFSVNFSYVDLFGNPWTCDCSTFFITEVLLHMVNNDIPVVTCWNPLQLRGEDVALLELECETQGLENTQSELRNNITKIITIVLFDGDHSQCRNQDFYQGG